MHEIVPNIEIIAPDLYWGQWARLAYIKPTLSYQFLCLGKKRFSKTEYFLNHGNRSAWYICEGTRV